MATVQDANEHTAVHGYGSGPAPGETLEQHAAHAYLQPPKHWGLGRRSECILFYCFAIPSWGVEIAAAVLGSYYHTSYVSFIVTATVWLTLWATAWLQTSTGMIQRASWLRDEANLKDRKQYLYLAVRLQRLMLPTALIAFVTFLVNYVRRETRHDTASWLIFLIFFIYNTVGSVMNAYNNITWELDRLNYEEGEPPMKFARLAILGISS